MKSVSKTVIAIIAATVMMWQFSSCEKYILPQITATPDTLLFTPAAGSLSSSVSANVKCTVSLKTATNEDEEDGEPGNEWMSCDGMEFEGKGSALFTITVTENVSGKRRNGAVVISSEAFEKKIIVIQD